MCSSFRELTDFNSLWRIYLVCFIVYGESNFVGAAAGCEAGYPMFSIESASSETGSEMKLMFKEVSFWNQMCWFLSINQNTPYLFKYLV